MSIEQLVSEWHELVEELRMGYDRILYEWDNDLGTRQLIEERLTELPEARRARLVPEIERLDKEYLSLTRPRKRPMRVLKGWWYDRVPVHPGSELAQEMEAEGE